jgi:hypothetical protein
MSVVEKPDFQETLNLAFLLYENLIVEAWSVQKNALDFEIFAWRLV